MKRYSFYHRETGAIHSMSVGATDQNDAALNTPADHIAIDGHFDALSQRVDIATGDVIDYQPPPPSAAHDWNADTKRWQLCPSAQATLDRRAAALAGIAVLEAKGIRAIRELSLSVPGAVDRVRSIDDQITALRADL